MKDKFNYEAKIIWECPCCGHRWAEHKMDYCSNCEVRMTYPSQPVSEKEIDHAIHDVCVLEERLTRHYQVAQQPLDEIRKLQQRQRNVIKELLNR